MQQEINQYSMVFIVNSLMDILTILIGSLCDNSIRTSTHFRVSRHVDRVSCVLF